MKIQTTLSLLACCALVGVAPVKGEADESKLVEYVHILQGTDFSGYSSHGNSLPLSDKGQPYSASQEK